MLVAIVRKELNLPLSLHSMLQILSVTPFENVPLFQLLTESGLISNRHSNANQLNLF